jgi:hypothetical protein
MGTPRCHELKKKAFRNIDIVSSNKETKEGWIILGWIMLVTGFQIRSMHEI